MVAILTYKDWETLTINIIMMGNLHVLLCGQPDYADQVLAFPCNQFGGQEPGSNAEVKAATASTAVILHVQVLKASLRRTRYACIYKHLLVRTTWKLLKSEEFVCFNVLVWKLKVSFSVKAFAQDKCPDTFPLFSKIDVNGANEAMAQSIQQSIHVNCRCSLALFVFVRY